MDNNNKADEFNRAKRNNIKGFSVIASSEKKKKGILWPLIKFIFRLIITLIIIFALMHTFFPKFTKQAIDKTNLGFIKDVLKVENNDKEVAKAPIKIDGNSSVSEQVAAKVLPSIVGIELEYGVKTVFSGEIDAKASGSGIIISEDGYILTNNHVVSPGAKNSAFYKISEGQKVTVTLNDEKEPIKAKIIGVDPLTDLAVIKIDKKGLVPADLGNSDDVKIGEFAMAIGNPLGLRGTVTAGIISAINREVSVSGQKFKTIQTDASINEGNSGGALVNNKGQVIGINTLKFGGNGVEGIGFAIPINQTKEISKSLIENGKVLRPTIGIAGVPVRGDLKTVLGIDSGVLVAEVVKNSSADKAGIKKSDVIVEFNGKPIATVGDLNAIKSTLKENDEVKVVVIRSGEKKTLTMKMLLEPADNKEDNKDNKDNSDNKENKKEEKNEDKKEETEEKQNNSDAQQNESITDNIFDSFFKN